MHAVQGSEHSPSCLHHGRRLLLGAAALASAVWFVVIGREKTASSSTGIIPVKWLEPRIRDWGYPTLPMCPTARLTLTRFPIRDLLELYRQESLSGPHARIASAFPELTRLLGESGVRALARGICLPLRFPITGYYKDYTKENCAATLRLLDEMTRLDQVTFSFEEFVLDRHTLRYLENLIGKITCKRLVLSRDPVFGRFTREEGEKARLQEFLARLDMDNTIVTSAGFSPVIIAQLPAEYVRNADLTFPHNYYLPDWEHWLHEAANLKTLRIFVEDLHKEPAIALPQNIRKLIFRDMKGHPSLANIDSLPELKTLGWEFSDPNAKGVSLDTLPLEKFPKLRGIYIKFASGTVIEVSRKDLEGLSAPKG